MPTLEELRERINLRLDESFVGISHQVAELPAADLVELLNQLTLTEAAGVMANDSVRSRPTDRAPSRSNRVAFSLWSGQAG